ncbi:MAG: 2-oxoglutarate dehydrogenase, E2 component, dihydrolipoamide succinyltransferase [Calditrichia bacterium]
MKIDVLMPKLGESITEGTIVKWWKQPGDHVKKDETLLEISTDKVDSEIPSPYDGVIVEHKFGENDTVSVDSIIAVIDSAGDDSAAAEKPAAAATPAPAASAPAPVAASAPAPAAATTNAAYDVEMPKLGESITEGTIVKWLKSVGDSVEKDETLLEISTDKVDSEIPSPYAGTITELLASENDTVGVGNVIARIASGDAPAAATSAPAASAPAPVAAPTAAPAMQPPGVPAPIAASNGGALQRQKGGRFYSPLVLSIARTEGVSMATLETLPGTGVDGRVTKKDILKFIESGAPAVAPAPAAPMSAPAASAPKPTISAAAPEEIAARYASQNVDVYPMDNIRKKIADHMVMSKNTSPHVYGVAEVDFTNIVNLVKKHREPFRARAGMKLTINPFILFCVTKAIRDFPDINSSVEGHTVIRRHDVNLGMAVATERGLLVPTIKNAGELNFTGIAKNAYDLAIKARDKKLVLEEIQGATFTVTNYGVFGNVIGFPIINQPNVAILGVAAIKKRPVVIETEMGDHIGIRSIGFLTLSYDHRIVDGELGDKFIQRVVHYLHTFDESWL